MKKTMIIFTLLTLLSLSAFAEKLTFTDATAIAGRVEWILVFEDGGYLVRVKNAERQVWNGSTLYPFASRTQDHGELKILGTAEQKKEMLSLLMMAKTTDQKVFLRLDGRTSGSYNVISYIRLID